MIIFVKAAKYTKGLRKHSIQSTIVSKVSFIKYQRNIQLINYSLLDILLGEHSHISLQFRNIQNFLRRIFINK